MSAYSYCKGKSRSGKGANYKKTSKPQLTSTVTADKYQRHLTRAKASGSYFIFFRHYRKLLNKLPCLFLQDLINLCSMPGAETVEIDGKTYTLCTTSFLRDSGMSWTSEEQKYHFGILGKKGYVERARKGAVDGPRWVWIDFEKLEDDLDEALGRVGGFFPQPGDATVGGKTPQPHGGKTPPYKRSNYVTTKDRKKRRSDAPHFNGNGKSPPVKAARSSVGLKEKKPDPECLTLAAQFRQALRKENQLVLGSNISNAEHLRLLRDVDTQHDFAEVLDWYGRHCNQEFRKEHRIPRIDSCKQFRKHFGWLHDLWEELAAEDRTIRQITVERDLPGGLVERIRRKDGRLRPGDRLVED